MDLLGSYLAFSSYCLYFPPSSSSAFHNIGLFLSLWRLILFRELVVNSIILTHWQASILWLIFDFYALD